MSEWYEPKGDDIDIDFKTGEVNLLVTHNDFGNVYASLTFDQITAIYEKIKSLRPKANS